VLTVVRFLHRVLANRDWAVKGIEELLAGKSGLITPDGIDLFAGRFPYVRETGLTAEAYTMTSCGGSFTPRPVAVCTCATLKVPLASWG